MMEENEMNIVARQLLVVDCLSEQEALQHTAQTEQDALGVPDEESHLQPVFRAAGFVAPVQALE
jgi:hypothetical protein